MKLSEEIVVLCPCVIGGAYERAGLAIGESPFEGFFFEFGKCIGSPVFHDRRMRLGGLQVLAEV